MQWLPRSFVQLAQGVLVILASGDEFFLTSRNGPSPMPAPVSAPTAAPQTAPLSIQGLLSPADIASLPSVPAGTQIILLPSSAVLQGLPTPSPIPGSLQVLC